jgi:Coenzyme PQQ synthesis protein D (PqqD)
MPETTVDAAAKVYRHAPDVVSRQVGEESILVPISHNVGDLDYVYTLSPVAARVWSLIDGTRPVREIAQTISAEYDVSIDQAAADIEELVSDLVGVSLLLQVN